MGNSNSLSLVELTIMDYMVYSQNHNNPWDKKAYSSIAKTQLIGKASDGSETKRAWIVSIITVLNSPCTLLLRWLFPFNILHTKLLFVGVVEKFLLITQEFNFQGCNRSIRSTRHSIHWI